MTWQNTRPYQEQLKFIGDWLKEEFNFTDLCKRYGISRKTGYKLINRYKQEGEDAFRPRSHARHSHPNATSYEKLQRLIALKYRYPKWGPEKLRNWLLLNEPHESWPATSTIGDILKKHGLVNPRKYKKRVAPHTEPFSQCVRPNHIWSADFKGQFMVGAQ